MSRETSGLVEVDARGTERGDVKNDEVAGLEGVNLGADAEVEASGGALVDGVALTGSTFFEARLVVAIDSIILPPGSTIIISSSELSSSCVTVLISCFMALLAFALNFSSAFICSNVIPSASANSFANLASSPSSLSISIDSLDFLIGLIIGGLRPKKGWGFAFFLVLWLSVASTAEEARFIDLADVQTEQSN